MMELLFDCKGRECVVHTNHGGIPFLFELAAKEAAKAAKEAEAAAKAAPAVEAAPAETPAAEEAKS